MAVLDDVAAAFGSLADLAAAQTVMLQAAITSGDEAAVSVTAQNIMATNRAAHAAMSTGAFIPDILSGM